jgi:hypothetical protein
VSYLLSKENITRNSDNSISSETSAVQGDNYQGTYTGVVEIPSVENSSSFSMTISESNQNYSFFSSFASNTGF